MKTNSDFDLAADQVRELLAELGRRLTDHGLRAEMFVVGGAALALVYDSRRTTADIDAILLPRDRVLDEAARMAVELKLPRHWLSDAVIQMMPPNNDDSPRNLGQFGGLEVTVASPEYLLAMKAMVARKSTADLADAALLCQKLGIATEQALAGIVERYFGRGRYGAQELWFEDIIAAASMGR